ncbi:MAG: YicC/YloC family endoribonuclease [Verrucomicrobiales bacterium]
MTGFARGEAVDDEIKIVVELSSVNRKQTEVVVNLPRKLSELEATVRKAVAQRIARGRVTVQISVESTVAGLGSLEVDEHLAGQYREALGNLARQWDIPLSVGPGDLLRAPGVFSVGVTPFEGAPALEAALHSALEELEAMHAREGAHLEGDIVERIRSLQGSVEAIRALAPDVVSSYRANLHRRLEEAGFDFPLDDERLVREIGIFAERCDITEETTRLESHFQQFQIYLESEEPVGRAMDFLSQEINRELNTIGSKANNALIAQHVVDAKTELEKVREQVQNVQ